MKIGFLLFALPFLVLIAIASVTIFKSAAAYGLLSNMVSRRIFLWMLISLPIVLIITMAIGAKVYSAINSIVYVIAATWLAVLLYLFMAAVVLAIVNLIAVWMGFPINMYLFAIGALVIVLGATAYGIVNATQPRIVEYTIDAPALRADWSGKNIILVSDPHLGVVRSESFMQKVVDKINAQNPDIVLIAGDIIDGPVFDYAKGLAPLTEIHAPDGVIYTPGNHEGYNTKPEKFFPIVKALTTTLIDRRIRIRNTDIIGLDYKMESSADTMARLTASGFTPGEPTIVIMHDPKNTEALREAGVSLVVSGHTHCGQFFPLNLVVKSIYKEFTYGVTKKDATYSITTCGVGTAMSPLRLGTNPEIVVIHIK